MDELLQKVAELRGMPPSLVERSAQAKAQKLGISVEEVLREWAGESTGEPAPTPPAAPTPAAAGSGGGLTLEQLLEKVAQIKGMPPSLVERSAQARAKKEGIPLEAVLAEWAGEEAPVPAAAAATTSAPAPTAPATAEEVAAPEVEVLPAEAEPPAPEAPAEQPAEAPTRRYPVWLATVFLLVPVAALLYLALVPNGPSCGAAGALAVDPVTGEAVGCDGRPYGQGEFDYFAAGETIYAAQCAACHGADGGGGVGPAFSGGAVLATFPEGSCGDHLEWVTLGSAGWPDPTYGATGKPVGGGMPAFSKLTPDELRAVVLYERVAFGGEDLDAARGDCVGGDTEGLGR